MSFNLGVGPHAVGFTDAVLENLSLPAGGNFVGASGLSTEVRIYYPSETGGENSTASTVAGKWPAISFTHGRLFTEIDNITQTNHKRATGLINHIVSHGFVVISINMSLVDRFQSYVLAARAKIVNAGLRFLKSSHEVGGVRLSELVDENRFGTLGHSRGGAAAVAADYYAEPDIPISCVGCISPVEGNNIATSKPVFILYGALDDDVSSGDPVKIFERCSGWKSFAYLDGASHFHFTDDLTVDMAVLPREQHAAVAGAYFTAFFKMNLDSDTSYDDALVGEQRFNEAQVNISFQHVNNTGFSIDSFETDLNGTNSLGGPRNANGFDLAVSGQELNFPNLGFFSELQKGLVLRWESGTTPVFETQFPEVEFLQTQVFTFRLSQLRAIGASPKLEDCNVTVEFEDAEGQVAICSSQDVEFSSVPFASRNPFWNAPSDISSGMLVYVQTQRKDIFGSCRIPLSKFRSSNNTLNLERVVAIRLNFPDFAGAVIVDDFAIQDGVQGNA